MDEKVWKCPSKVLASQEAQAATLLFGSREIAQQLNYAPLKRKLHKAKPGGNEWLSLEI